jgi:hypothetical protein
MAGATSGRSACRRFGAREPADEDPTRTGLSTADVGIIPGAIDAGKWIGLGHTVRQQLFAICTRAVHHSFTDHLRSPGGQGQGTLCDVVFNSKLRNRLR